MKKLLIIVIALFSTKLQAQKNCSVTNHAFQAGEELNYVVNYNWGAIWMTTAEVTFSAKLEELNGKKVFHFEGIGGTYPKYDWFYKVRDKYESYADTLNLKPLRFKRDVYEGGNAYKEDYVFNQRKNKVYTSKQKGKTSTFDSLTISQCSNDVITAVFYARCLDFNSYKPNETIPFSFVMDGEVVDSYVRYIGKEVIYNDSLGYVRGIKFKPKLIEGTIFKGGEGMTVWVTDDKNRMPVYIESPIIVGTIKVNLNKYKGLRNPMDCLVTKEKE